LIPYFNYFGHLRYIAIYIDGLDHFFAYLQEKMDCANPQGMAQKVKYKELKNV